jgi:DNA-binding MarR family transcriptional regulator
VIIWSGTLTILPDTTARNQPENLAILLREPFRLMTDRLYARLSERGYDDFRVPHGAVFQFLDDAGTPVAELARRAQMTKQSMTELVAHLEQRGYVERFDDPSDRRARPVRATARGLEVYGVVREFVAETEASVSAALGADRVSELRTLLADLQAALREA